MALMANKNFPQNPVELKVRNRGEEGRNGEELMSLDIRVPSGDCKTVCSGVYSVIDLTLTNAFSQALYNEYVHFKETEIPAKEREKSHIEHLYRLLEVRGRTGGRGAYLERHTVHHGAKGSCVMCVRVGAS